jgi:hypothetical protein
MKNDLTSNVAKNHINTITLASAKKYINAMLKNEHYAFTVNAYKVIKKGINSLESIPELLYYLEDNITNKNQGKGEGKIAQLSEIFIDIILMKDLYRLLPSGTTVFHLKDRGTYGHYYGYFYCITLDKDNVYVPYSITDDIAYTLGLELKTFKSDTVFLRQALQYSSSHDVKGLIEDLSELMYNDKSALKQQQMSF